MPDHFKKVKCIVVPHLLVDVGLERVNFVSHTFFFSDSRNIFVMAPLKLRPGVHVH